MDVDQLVAQVESGEVRHTVTLQGTAEELLVLFGDWFPPNPALVDDVTDIREQLLVYLRQHREAEDR